MSESRKSSGTGDSEYRPGFVSRRELLWMSAVLGATISLPSIGSARTALAPFDPADRRLVAAVADLIIPATDTGGAVAAGVPAFIEKMVTRWFDPAERENFVAGMKRFANDAVALHGRAFADLAPEQKAEYLKSRLQPAVRNSAGQPPSRSSFAALMKRLTVFGYYTSELGGSIELSLNLVPGEYLPKATWKPGDRDDSSMLAQFSPLTTY